MKLNYKKMVEEIYKLLEDNDGFLFDMSCNTIPESRAFLQEEAMHMVSILGRVYMISHAISCTACQMRYGVKPPISPKEMAKLKRLVRRNMTLKNI